MARRLLPSTAVTIGTLIVYVGLRLSTLTFGQEVDAASVSKLASSIGIESLQSSLPLEQVALAGAKVTFYNVNTRETESFFFRNDGEISADDEKRLEHIFRCKRTGHERSVDRGLIKIMARLGARYPDRVFELVSAH